MITENIWDSWFGPGAENMDLGIRLSGFESLLVLCDQGKITYASPPPPPHFPRLKIWIVIKLTHQVVVKIKSSDTFKALRPIPEKFKCYVSIG